MKANVKEEKNWTRTIRLYMFDSNIGDFFQNFSYLGNIHLHSNGLLHTHTQRESGVLTKGKICRADLAI